MNIKTSNQESKTEEIDFNRLIIVAIIAIISPIIINSLLFLIGDNQGFFPASVINTLTGKPFALTDIILGSGIPAIGGVILLALLGRYIDRPITIYRGISGSIFLFSLVSPFFLEAPLTMTALFLAMHFVVAIFVIGFLTVYSKVQF